MTVVTVVKVMTVVTVVTVVRVVTTLTEVTEVTEVTTTTFVRKRKQMLKNLILKNFKEKNCDSNFFFETKRIVTKIKLVTKKKFRFFFFTK